MSRLVNRPALESQESYSAVNGFVSIARATQESTSVSYGLHSLARISGRVLILE